jgi:hypothetical protein
MSGAGSMSEKSLASKYCLCLLLASAFAVGATAIVDESILDVEEDGSTLVNESALNSSLVLLPQEDLSALEKEGLQYMVEEEKLAGDVYQALYEKWNLRHFSNIERAEKSHEAAVRTLLVRYSVPDPTLEIGKFSSTALQDLYDEFIERGSASQRDALVVGAEIEELDITDLDQHIAQTDRDDIKLVYENLKHGSENHLRAFVRNLEMLGFEYEPKYLSQDSYYTIVNQ